MWMEEFKLRDKSFKFDSSGDINLGYDVTMWRSDGENIHVQNVVAEYHPHNNSFTHSNHSSAQQLNALKVGPSYGSYCAHDPHMLQCVFTTHSQTVCADSSDAENWLLVQPYGNATFSKTIQ